MTVALIVLLIIVALIGVSLALGRTTREAQSVRDDEFLELDGSWIRYRVVGSGPPALLVHGLLSSSRIWESLAERLSERFTVYSVDLRGFGESDKPLSGYGVRHGSRVLHAFCSHVGLNNVAIVGHDVGGDMVVKLASDHPELAKSVTLVATPANAEQIDLPSTLWLATLPVIGPLFYVLGQYVRLLRKLWLRAFVSDKRDLPEELVEDAAASSPAALRSTFNTVKREISRERLARQARQFRAPVLLIAGEEDQIVDPQAVETWAANAPNSEVAVLESCGHLPMMELPEEFNARVLSFITGNKSHYSDTRYRTAPDSASPQKKPPEETSSGIDGLEPDEEASAPDPYSEPSAGGFSGRRGGAGDYREDETGKLGYTPKPPAGWGREQDAEDAGYSADESVKGDDATRPVEPVESPEPNGGGGRRRRRDGTDDLIPEVPDDLFRWSDLQKGRRGRSGRRGDDESGEDPGDRR
jgi:pimeloyl-ACP methyl ester carboxylesterase